MTTCLVTYWEYSCGEAVHFPKDSSEICNFRINGDITCISFILLHKRWPQTQRLTTAHVYDLIVSLRVRSLDKTQWGLPVRMPQGCHQGVSQAAFLSGVQGPFTWLLAEFLSWRLSDWGPPFLAGCQSGAALSWGCWRLLALLGPLTLVPYFFQASRRISLTSRLSFKYWPDWFRPIQDNLSFD